MIAAAALLATLAAIEQRRLNYDACDGAVASSFHTSCVVTPSPREGVRAMVYWLVPKAGSTSARTFLTHWAKLWDALDSALPSDQSPAPRYPECQKTKLDSQRHFVLGCSDPCVRRYVSDGALVFGIARDPFERFASGYRYTMAPTPWRAAIRCRADDCPAECPPGPWIKVDPSKAAACKPNTFMINATSGNERDGGMSRFAEYASSMADECYRSHPQCSPALLQRCLAPLGGDPKRLQRVMSAMSVADDDMHVTTQSFKYCARLCEGPGCVKPPLMLLLRRLPEELPVLAHLATRDARDLSVEQRARVVAAVAAAVPHANVGRNARVGNGTSDSRVMGPMCRYLQHDYQLMPFFEPPPQCAQLGLRGFGS